MVEHKYEVEIKKDTLIDNFKEKHDTHTVNDNKPEKIKDSSINEKSTKIAVNSDKEKKVSKNQKSTKIATNPTKEKEVPKNNKTVIDKNISSKKYQVVAASLKREDDANRFLNDLKKQGYKDAEISYVKGRYYYVLYNSFNDANQAQKYMNEISKKSPGTWVRTQN